MNMAGKLSPARCALQKLKNVWFWVFLAVFSALSVFLFYNQAFAPYTGKYFSDMDQHLTWACYLDSFLNIPSQAKTYPLFHLTVRAFSVFFDTEMSGALATASYNALTAVLIYLILCEALNGRKLKRRLLGAERDLSSFVLAALTFVLLICSMIILPVNELFGGEWHAYLGSFTPNPWHNPTNMVSRPFAIVCMYLFSRLAGLSDKYFKAAPLIVFSLSLALCTFAKPSFAMAFLPVAGIMLLIKLFSGQWKRTLIFGLCFIPTFALLIWQYVLVFAGQTESVEIWGGGMSVDFGAEWSRFSSCVPLSILLGGAFGIITLVFSVKGFSRRPDFYKLSVYVYFASLIEALTLRIGNDSLRNGDIMWGYMFGLFFLFLASAALLLKEGEGFKKWQRLACWSFLALHTVCGIWYFAWVLAGNFYQ
ncbi:MAG: hypothetical protein Q4B42_06110 [Oscillospiraceae bacterium]|nr:hypothetical protein [Oscillospiraceae bacterium]